MMVFVEFTGQDHLQALISIPYRDTGWTAPFASLRLITNLFSTKPDQYEFSYASNSTTLVRQDSPAMGLSTDTGDGKVHQIAVTRRGAALRWFRDGAHGGDQTLGTNVSIDWGTGSSVALGTRSEASAGESLFGKQVAALVWNRALTDGEIARLAADPFGPFRPRRLVRGGTAHAAAATLAGAATVAATASGTIAEARGFATATSAALHGLTASDAPATGAASMADSARGRLAVSDG